MKAAKPKSTWQKIRTLLVDIHLWLGLASGLIVIVVCLSGTLYVFNTEVRELALPELYKAKHAEGAVPMQIETLITKVKTETGGKVVSIRISSDPDRTYQFMVKLKNPKKEGTADAKNTIETAKTAIGSKVKETKKGKSDEKRPSAFAVNPYTGEVLGNISEAKSFAGDFMKTMLGLHRWLLLHKVEQPIFGTLENRTLGGYITGTSGIIFTLAVISGMVIWFPQKLKSWKQGLKVKWTGNWKRTNHDLHNTLGFYACIFLFVMGITGPQWSFSWYREGLRRTLGTYQPEGFEPPKDPVSVIRLNTANAAPLTIADYIKKTDEALPYKGDYNISLAKDSTSAIAVTKNRLGFFAPMAGDKLLLDQYTASVLKIDIFRDKPLNERITGSIKGLHTGEVYGLFTKLIYFLAALIATSLPVTGTMIWLNKLQKKKKKKTKKVVVQKVMQLSV